MWLFSHNMSGMEKLSDGSSLTDKVTQAPLRPGCYLFSDRHGGILYVGKAKCLRHRVRSYFTAAAERDWRTAGLVPRISGVEYLVTASELDALILEYKLIKEYKPPHNSQMKADERRPFLRVSAMSPYAAFSSCAEAGDDDAAYFDFFADEYDIQRTLALLSDVWGLPRCGKRSFAKRQSPCIYYSTGGCMAPCAGKADKENYAASVQEALRLLSGKNVRRMDELKREMRRAAGSLAFEKAARCKELIDGLAAIKRKSRLRFHLPDNASVLVLIRPHREQAFSAFLITDGQAVSRSDFPKEPDDGAMSSGAAVLSVPNIPPADGGWLAKCLVEVGAYKQFVTLPSGKSAAQAAEKAIRRFAVHVTS